MTTLFLATMLLCQDPTGFTDALNAARAQYGLAPVAHSAAAVSVAAANNAAQAARGLGHHVLGGYGQCAAVGMADALSALRAWLGSPSHAAILLDPGLTAVGCHGAGGCWTASTSSGGAGAVAGPPVMARPMPVYQTWQGWYYPGSRRWRWTRRVR